MKGKYIFDAFEYLDPNFIYMAETRVFPKPVWRKLVGSAAAACMLLVTGLWARSYFRELPAPAPEETEQKVQTQPQEEPTKEISDEELLNLIRAGEAVSEMEYVDHPFIFDSPRELTTRQLYMLFCCWAPPREEMQPYYNEEGAFYFPEKFIRSILDQHFKDYLFSIEELEAYDPETDTVRTPMGSGFGEEPVWELEMKDRKQEGTIVTCTLEFQYHESVPEELKTHRGWKEYRFQVEDGNIYFLSARAPNEQAGWREVASDEITYQNAMGENETYSYAYPEFTVDSEDARSVNEEIRKIAENYVEKMKKNEAEKCGLIYYQVSYDMAVNGEILSALLKAYGVGDQVEYHPFSFNKSTGKCLTGEEMLAAAGMTEAEFTKRVTEMTEKKFLEMNGTGKHLTGLNREGYQEQYELTMTENSFDASMPIFFDTEGQLCTVVRIYSIAGAACFDVVLPVSFRCR